MAGALPHSLSLIMSHNPSVLGAQVRVQPAGNPGCSWCRLFPTISPRRRCWLSSDVEEKLSSMINSNGCSLFLPSRWWSCYPCWNLGKDIRSCCWPCQGRLNCCLSVFPKHTPAPQLDWVRQCLIEIHEFWLRGERRPIAVQSGDPIALLANTCVSLIKGPLLWFPSTQSQDLKVIYHPIGLHMSNAAVKYH